MMSSTIPAQVHEVRPRKKKSSGLSTEVRAIIIRPCCELGSD
jgi:hypothetical protein